MSGVSKPNRYYKTLLASVWETWREAGGQGTPWSSAWPAELASDFSFIFDAAWLEGTSEAMGWSLDPSAGMGDGEEV